MTTYSADTMPTETLTPAWTAPPSFGTGLTPFIPTGPLLAAVERPAPSIAVPLTHERAATTAPHEHDPSDVLHELITAFSKPNLVHPAYVENVLTYAAELLHARQNTTHSTDRPRTPTLMFSRSAALNIPDSPPRPPSAL